MQNDLISVIVPCFNEEQNIRGCLKALLCQESSYSYEIIVADSSSDKTPFIIRSEFPGVKLIHSASRMTCGQARNTGLANAHGAKILFTDADVRVPRDWLERMAGFLSEYDIVGGAVANGTPWSLTGSLLYYLEFIRCLPGRGRPKEDYFLMAGANLGYRAETLRGKRFLNGNLADETSMNIQLVQNGSRSIYVPTLSVIHINRKGWKNILAYQRKLGRAGYDWRVLKDKGKSMVLKVPLLMLFAPYLKVMYLLLHYLFDFNFVDFVKVLCLSPLLIVTDYFWVSGFLESANSRQRLGLGR